MNYVSHLLVLVCLYTVSAQSLNLLVGFSGLVSLSQAAFCGLGAYGVAILTVNHGWPLSLALPAAVGICVLLGLVVGIPSVRFRKDFFILVTLGFQMIIFTVLYNWTGLTNGSYGISGIPKPSFGQWQLVSPSTFLILAVVFAIVAQAFIWYLSKSPYGRTLEAIRDDEDAAIALGKSTRRCRLTVFVIAGAIAAASGGLYASYVTYIDPTSFTFDESVFLLAMVVIGGSGSIVGPILGAALLILLPEALRFGHIPDSVAPNINQIIYGLLLILAMRFRPRGILGRYALD